MDEAIGFWENTHKDNEFPKIFYGKITGEICEVQLRWERREIQSSYTLQI